MLIVLQFVDEKVLLVKHEFEISKEFIENTPEDGITWDDILLGIFLYLSEGLWREEDRQEVRRAGSTMKKTDDSVVITFEDDGILQTVSDLIFERMPLEPICA